MTAGSLEGWSPRERRVEARRRTVELVLDTIFRPGNWAARISEIVGLQGRVEISELTLDFGRAAAARPPLRVGFASDFHAGATTHRRVLEDACSALAALRPDVLLLGGDFVSVRASYVHPLAELLADVPAPLGKLAVLGNHDLRANWREVITALEGAGVQMITNSSVRLAAPFNDIVVSGIDDPTRGAPRPDLAMGELNPGDKRVLLMHSPDGVAMVGNRPFDLALAGHTHGGQIVLPNGYAPVVPGRPLNRTYYRGRFELDGPGARTLLVSRGIGTSAVPMRVFAAPEVHLCHLV
jgi:predicted MPP superfamily phosphohydrolase